MEITKIIQINQTIKIFLASSDELVIDRNAFGNLVRRLNRTYVKRGILLDLFEWEDHDAAYNDRRKQDEYNDQIRDSDMFLALFRTKAGKFTIEEFKVAVEEFRRTGTKPKNYVYIHDLFEGEVETDELIAFKHRLSDEMGYFWIRYNNNDSLQLHFVMQLQLVESKRIDSLKVENGEVKFEDMTIAQMDNLRFAASNEEYKRMNQRLAELPRLIEKARMHVENYPNEEAFKNGLQKLLNERNQLQKDFDQQQQFLLDTAMRIARLQGEKITDRMRRAMEAFEGGKVHEANIILDEAEHVADCNLTDYLQSKELTEQKRQNVINSIDELLLKTSIIMADVSIPIDERINQTKGLYAKADQLASEVDLDKEKHNDLLFDYAQFLDKYGLYKDAETVLLRQITIAEELYGKENEKTAISYNTIGSVYRNQGDFCNALKYHFMALKIHERIFGINNENTSITYSKIGVAYWDKGDYDKAIDFHFKALEIRKTVYGEVHHETANSYNNIGLVYNKIGEYSEALACYKKVLAVDKELFGVDDPNIAPDYNNIGLVLENLNKDEEALKYHDKAKTIFEKVYGVKHPHTATSYNNISHIYCKQGNYDEALEFGFRALNIWEKLLGEEHPNTASVYNILGKAYSKKAQYEEALKYLFKAMAIDERAHDKVHPDTADDYFEIGLVYNAQGDYDKALKYLNKAYLIIKKVFGIKHPQTKNILKNINNVTKALGSNG